MSVSPKSSEVLFQDIFNVKEGIEIVFYVKGESIFYTCETSPLVIEVSDYVHFGMFIKLKDNKIHFRFPHQCGFRGSYNHFSSSLFGRSDKTFHYQSVWSLNKIKAPFPHRRPAIDVAFSNKKEMGKYISKVWRKIVMPRISPEYIDLPQRGNKIVFGGFTNFRVIPKSSALNTKILISGFPIKVPKNFVDWIKENYSEIHPNDYPWIYKPIYNTKIITRGITKKGLFHIYTILFIKDCFLDDIVFINEFFEKCPRHDTHGAISVVMRKLNPNIKHTITWKVIYKKWRTFLCCVFSKKTSVCLTIDIIDMHLLPYLFPEKVITYLRENR